MKQKRTGFTLKIGDTSIIIETACLIHKQNNTEDVLIKYNCSNQDKTSGHGILYYRDLKFKF